jgi:hypothetical protein
VWCQGRDSDFPSCSVLLVLLSQSKPHLCLFPAMVSPICSLPCPFLPCTQGTRSSPHLANTASWKYCHCQAPKGLLPSHSPNWSSAWLLPQNNQEWTDHTKPQKMSVSQGLQLVGLRDPVHGANHVQKAHESNPSVLSMVPQKGDFLFLFYLLFLFYYHTIVVLGYIVTFTKVLTIYLS